MAAGGFLTSWQRQMLLTAPKGDDAMTKCEFCRIQLQSLVNFRLSSSVDEFFIIAVAARQLFVLSECMRQHFLHINRCDLRRCENPERRAIN